MLPFQPQEVPKDDLLQNSAESCGGLVDNAKVSAPDFRLLPAMAFVLSCKMWNNGKNLIRKHVLGERCFVFEAVVSRDGTLF